MTELTPLTEAQDAPAHGDIIWITGASSGLGRALALLLAQQGHWVVASARNRKALQQLAADNPGPGRIFTLPLDVTQSDSVHCAAKLISATLGRLDKLVANAGGCEYLDFPDPDWGAIERVFAVNFTGALNTIQAALPLLRKSPRRGHIVGVVSQAVKAPFTRAEGYGASKAAFDYFLQSLRLDLAQQIDVSCIYPGFIDTPLTANNDFPMPFLMSPEAAAQRVAGAIKQRAISLSFPRRLSAVLWLATIFPGAWRHLMKNKNSRGARP